jgi:hypothetical protein
MSTKTKSKTSPIGGKRGCLCDDDTYSKECCNGDLIAQGIGVITGNGTDNVTITEENKVRTIIRNNG